MRLGVRPSRSGSQNYTRPKRRPPSNTSTDRDGLGAALIDSNFATVPLRPYRITSSMRVFRASAEGHEAYSRVRIMSPLRQQHLSQVLDLFFHQISGQECAITVEFHPAISH